MGGALFAWNAELNASLVYVPTRLVKRKPKIRGLRLLKVFEATIRAEKA
jgi:hypothetical protein